MKIDAYIPASAGESMRHTHYPQLLSLAGVENKAMIRLAGKPMIEHVFDAINGSDYISSITLVGDGWEKHGFDSDKPLHFITGGNTSYDTLVSTLNHFKGRRLSSPYLMSISCDIPLITTQMIDAMVQQVDLSQQLELYLNVCTADTVLRNYPDAHKVPIKLKETHLFVGDIHIFKPNVIAGRERALMQLLENRKNVWAIIKVISLRYIFKYILRRLSIDDIKYRFKQMFDLDAAFVLTEFPESCLDVDYASDLILFEDWMKSKPTMVYNDKVIHTITSSKEMQDVLRKTK